MLLLLLALEIARVLNWFVHGSSVLPVWVFWGAGTFYCCAGFIFQILISIRKVVKSACPMPVPRRVGLA